MGTRPDLGQAADAPIPVVLPFVLVSCAPDGSMTITLDGTLVASGPIDRAGLGAVLGSLAEQQDGPIRVEVREADGSRFVDILSPPPRRSPFAPPEPPAPTCPAALRHPDRAQPGRGPAELIEIAGDGFVPGEDIAVAMIVHYVSASGTGRGRALLDSSEVAAGTGSVLLFGVISGTLVHSPAQP